jgi:hypothetical protein
MNQQELSSYINSLPLASGNPYKTYRSTLGVEASTEPAIPIKEGTEQSFFAEKSIISFAAEVSEANRQDILNATLFSQMAANTVPDEPEKLMEWYRKFIEVLAKTGWIIEGHDLQTYNATGSVFEVQNVIVDILTSAFGAHYITIIKKTLDAIKNMSSEDKKIKAFEKNVNKVSKGCFQLALANEQNGQVSMQLGTFILTSTNTITSILFFKTEKTNTRLDYISKRASFNAGVYQSIRKTISDKLGEKLATNIAEIPLA